MEKERLINLQLFGENQETQKTEVENNADKQPAEKPKEVQKEKQILLLMNLVFQKSCLIRK